MLFRLNLFPMLYKKIFPGFDCLVALLDRDKASLGSSALRIHWQIRPTEYRL